MRYEIIHELNYSYDSPVRLSTQYLRLSPRDTARQKVLDWKIETPGQAMRTSDGYGNVLHVLTLDKPVSEIWIHAGGVVETSQSIDQPSDFTGASIPPQLFLRPTAATRVDAELAAFADAYRAKAAALPGLRELAAAIHAGNPGASGEHATHRFLAACRHLGVPARYVSGYIHKKSVMAINAWAEALVENRWRSFDIVNDCPIGEAHVKIAVGADYLDACPIRGVRVGGGLETLVTQAKATAGAPSAGQAMKQRQQ